MEVHTTDIIRMTSLVVLAHLSHMNFNSTQAFGKKEWDVVKAKNYILMAMSMKALLLTIKEKEMGQWFIALRKTV